ncbi:MAG: 30S ribosomal protein S6 [Elusimicrobia bacterium]|nr:30S ribosomal protein S6 [Elusimicrobiota bacterium]
MNRYETIYVCSPVLPADDVSAIADKVKSIITQAEGQIIAFDNWGKRKFAYPVSGQREGVYVFIDFTAPSDLVSKIENFYRMNEGIFRFLTVRKETAVRKTGKPKNKKGAEKADSPGDPEQQMPAVKPNEGQQ